MIAFHSVGVRPYFPKLMKCFKSFKFCSESCTKPQQFCICGLSTHEGNDCQNPKCCANCNLPHNLNSRDCGRYNKEMEIQKIKVLKKVSYFKTKRKISSLPTYNISYSQVTRTDTIPEIIVETL